MIDELLQDAREHMEKSVDATRHKFGSVRTGRASTALLDRITVDYYGTQTPLKQLATVSAPARCPSSTGRPRCRAQRPLPSVMMATYEALTPRGSLLPWP